MFTYTSKDSLPANAVYLAEEAKVYGDLYLGSLDGLDYLDEEKRIKEVVD